jgi:hypothetical protein
LKIRDPPAEKRPREVPPLAAGASLAAMSRRGFFNTHF